MQGQQEQAFTFEQKVNILQYFALFPALTIMVFLRRKIGFRFLDLLKIQFMVVLLWAYGGFSAISFGPAAGGMVSFFALIVLIAAIVERRMRWNEIKRGIPWHTYSRGISWFNSFLPLSETAAKRFIDPAVALIAGIVFFFLFRPLGFYLILSAVCLFLFETIDYQKQIDLMLDQLDNLVQSEVVSENVDYFQQGGVAGARPVEETAGIPTGTDPDLAAAIERRRAQSRKSQQTQKAPPAPELVADSSSMQSPQYLNGYQQQVQVTSEPLPPVPRRRAMLPDNLVVTDSSQPDNLPEQSISMQPSPSQLATALPAAPVQAQVSQQQQGIPVIKSLDDPAFAALPSGAQFVTPDGKTRWKK